ncbi:cell surface glycoprotein CD200 receptor 1-like isoform 1-T1 [Clarias gariepinus]
MERKLFLRLVFLSAVCLTRSHASANNTQPHSTTDQKHAESRNEVVELGTTVTLNCTSRKIAWQDIIFVIWKINLKGKECKIAVAKNDSDYDTCQDGKKLTHTAQGTYHLVIPNFSVEDEGTYTCDTSYTSGGSMDEITVSAWARPHLSGWLEYQNGHTIAVCEATGKPQASILWNALGNTSLSVTQATERGGQVSTVISRLHIPRHASHRNLTCVATVKDLKIKFSNFTFRDAHIGWPIILVGVCATCSIVALLTGLYIMRKSFMPLSIFRKICCKPDTPAPSEEKPQQPYDPEELQPYASYVQRVNSIYNSSAELFNA